MAGAEDIDAGYGDAERADPEGMPREETAPPHSSVRGFQKHIDAIYGERDAARGVESTFMWFAEEVGELARALRRDDPENLRAEFGDVFAWLATLASLSGVDMEEAASRYAAGCPRCGAIPCGCRRGPERE